jgi:DNA gyrase subunit A
MVVTISHKGYAKRCSPSVYKAQRRGGKGVMGTKKLAETEDDFVSEMFVASTHSYLLVFTTTGKLHWLKVYALPEASRTARGRAIVNILNLKDDEKVSTIIAVREFEKGKNVVMVTRRGYIKRVDLMELSNIRRGGIKAVNLAEGDELIGVRITDGTKDMIVSAKSGLAIRFSEDDARIMGRTARGSRAIRLGKTDEVVAVTSVPHADGEEEVALLTVCENGYGKRTAVEEYRCQARGGKGVIDIKTDSRNGKVVAVCRVTEENQIMIITTAGKIIRMPVDNISLVGRNTKGVRLVGVDSGEAVAAVARIAEADADDDSEEIVTEEA